MVVDGMPFRAWLTADYQNESYQLRLRIKADFGARSSVVIEGLRNVGRWEPYGYWYSDSFNAETETIAVTPRLIAVLIRHALNFNWQPDCVKSEHRLKVTNVEAKTLLATYSKQLANP